MTTNTTEFPLGVYAGNPNGNDSSAESAFETQYASFVATMGTSPQFMDAFTDLTQDPSQWPSNASWTAWSWAQSVDASSLTPVIGVPMGASDEGSDPDQFYRNIMAGDYDNDYKGIVDGWAGQGFSTLDLRLGYEMNVAGYNPWYMGNDPSTIADWVGAFQHLSTLLKSEGAQDGVNVQIVWNPAASGQSDSAQQVESAYPGDQYVDVIGTDIYNSSGASAGSWSLQDAIGLAEAHGKPIAIPETGAGGTNYGPTDDPAFPAWLASTLAQTGAPPVDFVNVWDASADGDWDFSSAGSDKPQEAAAWAQHFGEPSDPPVSQEGPPNSTVQLTDSSGDQSALPVGTAGSQNWDASQTGLNDNVSRWVDGSGTVNLAAQSLGLVDKATLDDNTGRSFQISNFVETDAQLSGAPSTPGTASTVTINAAQRGTLSLDSGNYNVTFNAQGADNTPSDNLVQLSEGSGNDQLTLNSFAGVTQANVQAGSGTDVMQFINTGPVQVSAGAGEDTITGGDNGNTITASTGFLNVTGGTGPDTYRFAAGDGAMTINDFSPEQGDTLQISSALQPELQESSTNAGMVLNFANAAGDITLTGAQSLPPSAVHWTG